MTQVPCRSGQVGRFSLWIGHPLSHSRKVGHRRPHGRRAASLYLVVRIEAGGVASVASKWVTLCIVPGAPRAYEHYGPFTASQRLRLNGTRLITPVYTDYTATQYPVSMSQGDSWPQETPYGSRGYISAGYSPPQPSSSSPDVFNPNCVIAQLTPQGKAVNDSVLGFGFDEVCGGSEVWVADQV